jgi:NAD(P)H-flavin reductase
MAECRPVPSHLEKVFYRPDLAEVLRTKDVTSTEIVLDLALESGKPLGHTAGQFVQLSVFGYGEAPISVCSSPTRERFQLCVRDAGNVTRAVHNLVPGNRVGIRGPYGRGFPVTEMEGRDIVIIAGGIGLAPLRSLITYILDCRDKYGRVDVVYGARDPSAILFRDDLKAWDAENGMELQVIVDKPDDRWQGRTGVVTLPIRDLEFRADSAPLAVVVGPPVMYKFVAMELFNKGFTGDRIYFSLERRFRCGVGKCGHCQLNDVYVCQDGPVFRFSDLVGRSEAVEAWTPESDRR